MSPIPTAPIQPPSDVLISEEALRRLRVEAAFGRGEKIEFRVRCPRTTWTWTGTGKPMWDWVHFDYRIEPTEKPRRTRADILDQLHALLVELRELES